MVDLHGIVACLKTFVADKFRTIEVKPSVYDRSWFPTRKSIRNHVQLTSLRQKLSQIDQVNLEEHVKKWMTEDSTRKFCFRPCTATTDLEKVNIYFKRWLLDTTKSNFKTIPTKNDVFLFLIL